LDPRHRAWYDGRVRALALAALLIAVPRAFAAADPADLAPGRYSVALRGLVCTVCARAIAAEWSKLPEVESASVDFDRETGDVAVRLNTTLRVSALRRALRRAERVANLGARYELGEIKYIP
jgi:hypothetical protein